MSLVVHANLGNATHHLKNGVTRHFRPHGPTYIIDDRGGLHSTATQPRRNPIERLSGGGLSARVFVGLNVGETPTYTLEEVVKETTKIRLKQGALADASFLAQRGVYTQSKDGKLVTENSVQIIIIDVEGKTKDVFTEQVNSLGIELRARFEQESVIVEIQERGIVQDVYSITA